MILFFLRYLFQYSIKPLIQRMFSTVKNLKTRFWDKVKDSENNTTEFHRTNAVITP